MALLIDSGFLYAIFNQRDKHHQRVVQVLSTLGNQTMILPVPVIVETAYLLYRKVNHQEMRHLLIKLINGPLTLESLNKNDLSRIHELLENYKDAELDFVDACITALAERLDIQTILTIDQRDFRMIRPTHCSHFEILP